LHWLLRLPCSHLEVLGRFDSSTSSGSSTVAMARFRPRVSFTGFTLAVDGAVTTAAPFTTGAAGGEGSVAGPTGASAGPSRGSAFVTGGRSFWSSTSFSFAVGSCAGVSPEVLPAFLFGCTISLPSDLPEQKPN
jgi:hypothetical protein